MRFRKIVVERVTVVKFRVDNIGSDGTGCFRPLMRNSVLEELRVRIFASKLQGLNEKKLSIICVKVVVQRK